MRGIEGVRGQFYEVVADLAQFSPPNGEKGRFSARMICAPSRE